MRGPRWWPSPCASKSRETFDFARRDRKSTRLNSSHTVISTLSLHDALPISAARLERIEQKLGALSGDELVIQAHTEKAQAALDHILRRRSLPLVDARAEMVALAVRLEIEGDLRFCAKRSEEHTSELQSHSDLHSFPTRRSSDLGSAP